MGWGFDDYMLTHTIDQFHASVDIDTIDDIDDDDRLAEQKEWFEDWKKKKEETSTTPVIGKVNTTDLGNAERLHLREGQNIKWSADANWRIWDGKRWTVDKTQRIIALASATVRKIYAEANPTNDQDRR